MCVCVCACLCFKRSDSGLDLILFTIHMFACVCDSSVCDMSASKCLVRVN